MWSLDNNVVILLHNIICTIWFIETRYQQERDRYWVEKKSARCKILSILNKHHYQSQDEISPFSRLNGDWMVAEWRLNGDGKGEFQSTFSHHSVTLQSTEWQTHFSDLSVSLFFEKLNCAWRGSNPGCEDHSESTLTITPREP